MRFTPLMVISALAAGLVLTSCQNRSQTAQNEPAGGSSSNSPTELTLPSGSSLDVTLSTPISSENAGVGSSWNGTIRNASMLEGRNLIPVGSAVSGTVVGVTPARKGDLAMLDLGLTNVTVDGHDYAVRGSMESVVAGSTRARNLGVIGAAAAAGAVVGHAVTGTGKGTIIGAVVGGGAATGAVAATKGYQVELKAGTPLIFTTNEAVAVRF